MSTSIPTNTRPDTAGTTPAEATGPALRARGLSKSYQSPVLTDLDLDIEQGQFVAIMGPSGSGKSTLLHCLSGMDRPTDGSVLLGDTEMTTLSEKELAALRLTRFGFVFQQAHLMTTLCLLDNIVLPGFLAGLRPRAEVTARGQELMKRMGIAELAASGVTEVSGGQLQRAGILLGEVHASGTTLVMVTHDAQVAARADRVLVLVDGRIEEDLSLGRYRETEAPSRLVTVTEALQRRSV